MAEEVGFEPTVACTTTVFETVLFGRSSTLPSVDAIGTDHPECPRKPLHCLTCSLAHMSEKEPPAELSATIPTRKRADGRETIARLLEAGEKEMETFGYMKFNLDRIIATTGISRGSIYHHFGDRDGLIAAVETEYLLKRFDAGMADLEVALDAAKTGEEAFTLVQLGISFSGAERQRALRWRRISTLASARSADSIYKSLQESQKRGTPSLARMLDKLRDRGLCEPTVPTLGLAYLIQSILIGRILVDIVEDPEADAAWEIAVIEGLRYMLGPKESPK